MADLSVMSFLNEETQQETEYNLKDAQARIDIGTINGKIPAEASTINQLVTEAGLNNVMRFKADLLDGKVPSSQLPSYVDDVLEYASQSAFPATGETGKIYIALDTNKTYRWSGSAYVEISESLALGETASSAYAGSKGKANADAIAAMKNGSSIDSFGDVETALEGKVDKVTGKGLSTNDYNNTAKGIVDNIQANVIANTKLIKDTVGFIGKNKLPITLSKLKELNTAGTWNDNVYTFKGLTFTIAHDGDSVISITQTGTSTGTGYLYLGYLPLKNGDSFILNGSPSNTTAQTTYMRVGKGGTEGTFFKSNYGGSETAIDILEDDYYSFNIACGASGITGTYVWKPMLRDANILDDTYEPYFGSTAFPRSEQAVLGAKNLGEIILGYYIQEASTGYFKLTADTNAITYIAKVEQNTDYRCKKLASGDRFAITGFVNYPSKTTATNEASRLFDDASATEHVVNTGNYNYLGFTVNRTSVVSESSIKGMIYLASDTDSTYVPYAMTNRELTGKVQPLGSLSAVVDTGTVNVPTSTDTEVASISVSKGKYLLIGKISIGTTSTQHEIAISISSSNAWSSDRKDAITGYTSNLRSGGLEIVKYADVSSDTTYKLFATHNKGSNLDVYPLLEAIRIG